MQEVSVTVCKQYHQLYPLEVRPTIFTFFGAVPTIYAASSWICVAYNLVAIKSQTHLHPVLRNVLNTTK